MKLEHSTIVMSDGRKIVTSAWHTASGKTTSQAIKSTDLKTGKVTVINVSGGKLLPQLASSQLTSAGGLGLGTLLVKSPRVSPHLITRPMGHRHFCDVACHWWECEGAALRPTCHPHCKTWWSGQGC